MYIIYYIRYTYFDGREKKHSESRTYIVCFFFEIIFFPVSRIAVKKKIRNINLLIFLKTKYRF